MSIAHQIKSLLPYGPDFCFVDELEQVNEQGVIGYYRFPESAPFYDSHFPDYPVTPGVLLTETMAQIGLVALGIYLSGAYQSQKEQAFVFTESQVFYLKKVLPGARVKVISEKVYYRLGKLKCKVAMYNEQEERICYGTMAGMAVSADEVV
ncbi:MAG: beta-hydroxyacyl-ACP dehydratase [Saprospiraceae bacterium]